MIRLNLGCGKNLIEGWTNVDRKPSTQGWEHDPATKDQVYDVDLNGPWPWKDNSVDAITVSHLLYCMSADEKRHVIRECYRVLKPYGIVRITDDDNEDERSMYFNALHHNSQEKTSKRKIVWYMEQAGFAVVLLNHCQTISPFLEICVDLHHDGPAIFFLEGCKE